MNPISRKPEVSASTKDESEAQSAALIPSKLPFSRWMPVLGGALFGVALRLIFSGDPGYIYSAMGGAFICFVPLAVGAITVFLAERQRRRHWTYYIWAPALATVLFILGTMVILIEGQICAVIIAPLFAVIGGIGGLMMGAVCRLTNWPRQAVYSFSMLPLLLGAIPIDDTRIQQINMIERVIVVHAPANAIWNQLLNARDIRPDEVGGAWMYRIGVPLPVSGVTQQTPVELVRKVSMGKSIHFEQVSNEWKANQHVRWTYRFAEDSFPPHALDDHVKIGGHYFDLIDTAYTLRPIDADSTELKVKIHYRVSTQFDWYADLVAQILIGNFETVILSFYRTRAENTRSS